MGEQLEAIRDLGLIGECQFTVGDLQRRVHRAPAQLEEMSAAAVNGTQAVQTATGKDVQGLLQVGFPGEASAVGSEQCQQGGIRQSRRHLRTAEPRMPQADAMAQTLRSETRWSGRRIGITGARGRLGQALGLELQARGAHVVGLTHSRPGASSASAADFEWVVWECGKEEALDDCLAALDILVINHGVNPQGAQDPETLNRAIEVNALSAWRLMQRFEACAKASAGGSCREVWVNTSEAEIQPAVSPAYELSKRLIGQLVSLRGANLGPDLRQHLVIRKLVLGPFRSELNPIGVMAAEFVVRQVLMQVGLGLRLVIVTPNPLTYVLMPLAELGRWLYSRALSRPGR